MRKYIALALLLSTTVCAAMADDKPVLSPAEKARLKAQVEALQKSKSDAAATANKAIKDAALGQGATIDEKTKKLKDRVDKDAESYSWYYGKDAATAAGATKKQHLQQEAQTEKDRIAAEARRRAAAQNAGAQKSIKNINDSVDGLKSQVAKKGQYGLQPQGSSLTVRNYGKK
jgi:hypothetical protein